VGPDHLGSLAEPAVVDAFADPLQEYRGAPVAGPVSLLHGCYGGNCLGAVEHGKFASSRGLWSKYDGVIRILGANITSWLEDLLFEILVEAPLICPGSCFRVPPFVLLVQLILNSKLYLPGYIHMH